MSYHKTFVMLDDYELQLIRKLTEDLKRWNKAKGKKAPSQAKVIGSCVRTAIHAVYGDEYGYTELLSEETFKELMDGALNKET